MHESQLEAIEPQVYERLLDRLGLALERARTAMRLRDEMPAELELRGLSRAEFDLINAYLSTDRPGRCAGASIPREQPGSGNVVWLSELRRARAAKGTAVRFRG
jgi:hypothetical protein